MFHPDVSDRKKEEVVQVASFVQQNNLAHNIYGMVYVNPIGQAAFLSGSTTPLPRGTMIVREKLVTESPELLTVMIKHEKGFNPACGDWEFLVVSGNQKKIEQRQKVGSCQACHAKAENQQYLFRSYLKPIPSRLSPS
ncbi:MAG: cytochrome P460 family protein [Blastocatellia bacterium]|nr:cytochrome P460 family protein [Blastocatellia bacterium]